ncbi:hypothetical protein BP6252_02896 [Coleophoma cylindrospora]|uniref:N-acetyltransferase domain-containing protein n=1 Tax=Coleophoma cylindrospora TaxID=1849047 RepID=A0A3D8SG80_9HELO|nr:hypothetical protein BP6252_02896 [Coleophoma cylindrospora]
MSQPKFAPFLYTARLTLRLYSCSEDDAFTAELARMPEEKLNSLVNRNILHRSLLKGHKAPGPAGYIIYLGSATGPKVGLISISQRKEGFPPDIGWAVVPDQRRKGFATEAATECLRFWQEELGLQEICALLSRENVASQGIAERIGLVNKGTIRLEVPSGSSEEILAYGNKTAREFKGEVIKYFGEPEEDEDEKVEKEN